MQSTRILTAAALMMLGGAMSAHAASKLNASDGYTVAQNTYMYYNAQQPAQKKIVDTSGGLTGAPMNFPTGNTYKFSSDAAPFNGGKKVSDTSGGLTGAPMNFPTGGTYSYSGEPLHAAAPAPRMHRRKNNNG